jgi:hypothetical protein
MGAMQAFLDSLKLDVAAGQVRRRRQQLEIVDVERRLLICAQEGLVGLPPRAAFVTLTALPKMIHLKPPQLADLRTREASLGK